MIVSVLLISGVSADAQERQSYIDLCQISMDQRAVLACFDTFTNKMVGVNILWIVNKNDNLYQQLDGCVSLRNNSSHVLCGFLECI